MNAFSLQGLGMSFNMFSEFPYLIWNSDWQIKGNNNNKFITSQVAYVLKIEAVFYILSKQSLYKNN